MAAVDKKMMNYWFLQFQNEVQKLSLILQL